MSRDGNQNVVKKNNPNRVFIVLVCFLVFFPLDSEAIKIASWNLLNYSISNADSRDAHYRNVINALDADILVVQEMTSYEATERFKNYVMNYNLSGVYAAAPFYDGPDTDNAFFYKKSAIKLISHQQIPTSLRDISEYVVELVNGPGKGSEFRIYSIHLKSGSSSSDKAQREIEATTIRNYLNGITTLNTRFLLCGDFNLYSSTEKAFSILSGAQAPSDKKAIDPINKLGDWSDNSEFAGVHTQSTRATQFGGGASGGLDDRFDFILLSTSLNSNLDLYYQFGSYKAFGNDSNHFNISINNGTNSVVNKEVADSLYFASDHLPVIVEIDAKSYSIFPPILVNGMKFPAATFSDSKCNIFLTWQHNPNNQRILKYRIYLQGENSRILLSEMIPTKSIFVLRNAVKERSYIFSIVAVNDLNQESEAAIIKIL